MHNRTIKRLIYLTGLFALVATLYSWKHDYIIAYGDAESHLDIAKRVLQSLTPGFAQFGGVWLPLPHALMLPFVFSDSLWKTGLAGSLVSGVSFIVASIYIYRLTLIVTKNKLAALISYFTFVLNPNILYMQSTPMTELPLLAFFMLSSFYFVKYLVNTENLISLIAAAFFGLCASVTRYDGWFLVATEGLFLVVVLLVKHAKRTTIEGQVILFSTLAFMGIALWFAWDWVILGDPLYFTNSPFSAKSQQAGWMAKGELPTIHKPLESVLYFSDASMQNAGIIIFAISAVAIVIYFADAIRQRDIKKVLILGLLACPVVFNILTLYLGQSIIFLPDLTPKSYEAHLFNARYGLMYLPIAAFLVGYLFSRIKFTFLQALLGAEIIVQMFIFLLGAAPIITLADGLHGLSSAKRPDAEKWMASNYDGGLVLMDDYSRTMSVIRSNIPIKSVIYVGTKPYWDESLKAPEKYATWIIVQQGDAVWTSIYDNPIEQGRLYKYFKKAYTSPEILIFRRN